MFMEHYTVWLSERRIYVTAKQTDCYLLQNSAH